MPRSLLIALLLVAAPLTACGGPPRPATQTAHTDDEDDDSYADDEDDVEDDRDDGEEDGEDGFIDQALLRNGGGAPIALGEATEVPGTGVAMRPPEGSQPMPFGAGFLSMRDRIQISIVVAEGPPEMLDAVRGGGGEADGPEEQVSISGHAARMGRDRLHTQAGELERTWLMAHDGHRGLAVVATYEASRAPRARPAMQESLASVTWDAAVQLDAAAALGIQVGNVEGFTTSRATTANVVLLGRGASFPPEPGQPVVTISPLPMQLASDQAAHVCEQLVARLLPVPTSAIEQEGAIEDGPLPGCERLATADAEGHRLATYAALVFANQTPILVTGTVEASEIARYRARFASAARAVRPRS